METSEYARLDRDGRAAARDAGSAEITAAEVRLVHLLMVDIAEAVRADLPQATRLRVYGDWEGGQNAGLVAAYDAQGRELHRWSRGGRGPEPEACGPARGWVVEAWNVAGEAAWKPVADDVEGDECIYEFDLPN